MSEARILEGDCIEVMAGMEPDSVDSIVTDPPYGLGFMGKAWDSRGVAFDPKTWAACYRVLKPGGRLLAFGGQRTHHRIWTAIEDAGFTIEDTVMWLFGQGFPKHKSKLKPAFEPICVARKGPVSALNIDAARIGMRSENESGWSKTGSKASDNRAMSGPNYDREPKDEAGTGRWPANVVLGCACDGEHEPGCAASMLDEQSGKAMHSAGFARTGSKNPRPVNYGGVVPIAPIANTGQMHRFGDSGGASRFLYCAKASRSEREHGLDGERVTARSGLGGDMPVDDQGRDRDRFSVTARNHHPTVKPLELMRWLVRLVTLPGELVLDPFAGSGTTGMACVAEGRSFIGIELDPEYAKIAERRIRQTQPTLFGNLAP